MPTIDGHFKCAPVQANIGIVVQQIAKSTHQLSDIWSTELLGDCAASTGFFYSTPPSRPPSIFLLSRLISRHEPIRCLNANATITEQPAHPESPHFTHASNLPSPRPYCLRFDRGARFCKCKEGYTVTSCSNSPQFCAAPPTTQVRQRPLPASNTHKLNKPLAKIYIIDSASKYLYRQPTSK